MPSQSKKNINKKVKTPDKHPTTVRGNLTLSQRASDGLTKWMGSWVFILFFAVYILVWMGLNMYGLSQQWDPYPFILLNLTLSCLAALQAPIILMSQNRSAQRDRVRSEYDYAVNRKAEREIQDMQKDLEKIKRMISEIKNR